MTLVSMILEGCSGHTFSYQEFNSEEDEVRWHYCALQVTFRDKANSATTLGPYRNNTCH